ncbi:MAG: TonB-dependent receptor [Gemmatimonadota bacterium]|nr:TonB-dependent receptor [Gemmatimonadota bacterium]MDH3424890.1 TonB-dependent receptor [Gemmatimonadota bacterium]
MRSAAVLLACAVSLPTSAWSQVIEGRVSEERGRALGDVSVTVLGQAGVSAISDGDGRFVLNQLPAGPLRIHFARLGYTPVTATVDVYPGETTPLAVAMSPEAFEIDGIDVSVEGADPFLEVNGFFRRTQSGFGLQLPRSRLDELRMLLVSDAMRSLSGIRLRSDMYSGTRVAAVRPAARRLDGQGCALTVYVDGVRTLDPNLNQVPPDWLIAMEVYRGAETPAEYRTSGNCGAVLLWTRQC